MNLSNLFYAGLLAAALAGTYVMTYKLGHYHGNMEILTEWNKANDDRKEAEAKFQKENAALMAAHVTKQQDLEKQLDAQGKHFDELLATASRDFDARLQLSEGRAGVYRRQAEGSRTEQANLAEHAARLDRSLEEGRGLVRELRETLGQRDRTIGILREVIINDRTLTGEYQ